MTIDSKMLGDELTIVVHGCFNYSVHKEFRNSFERAPTQPASYVVDMNSTTSLDSSALGMLLLLREYAGGDQSDIKITHCNSDVKKTLMISNFDQLFSVE